VRVFAKLIDSGGSVGDDDVVGDAFARSGVYTFRNAGSRAVEQLLPDLRNIFLDPRPLDKLFLAYTVMALPLPKQTEVFAVHRETTTGPPIDVPPGGLPPLVTLSLAPNKYLVTAKLLVINVSSEPRQVSCTLRPMGAPGTPYDTSTVTLAPLSQAGEMHNLVLHCVIELTAAGGVDVVCGHSGAVGDIRADYIWLTALSVSSVTKTEPI